MNRHLRSVLGALAVGTGHTVRLTRATLRSVLGVLAVGAGHTVRLGRLGARYVPGWTGAGLVSWGAGMAWRPAGLIVAGLFLLAADALIERRGGS